MSFLGEIKRRKIFQVAAVYAIVAWLVVQVADVTLPAFEAPPWILQVFILFMVLGFPITLVISWAFNLTAEGLVRDQGRKVSVHGSGRTIEYVLIGLLAVAMGWVLYRVEINPADEGVDVVSAASQREVLPNSVAVLPFENLSLDPQNAFFAAGIHDTILNEIAKIADMNVIARTSMLRYADGQTPIAQIAEELNVETIMEGTVQYAEGRVLVTAQLINPETSAHLWSGNYDREFADIFVIQADIATRIAMALEAELLPADQQAIERPPTTSPEAYALYFRGITRTELPRVIDDLEQATKIDPNFAEAYAQIAFNQAVALIGFTGPTQEAELERLIQSNAERALTLDSSLGSAHAALGAIHLANWRGREAEEALQRAYQLSPNGVGVAQMYARFKRHRREYSEAIQLMERVVELDPNNPIRLQNLGVAYRYAGDYERAVTAFERGLELEPTSVSLHTNLAIAQLGRGDHPEAIRQLNLAEVLSGDERPDIFRLTQMARTYGQAGRQDEAMRLFEELTQKAQEVPVGEATWASAYAAIGNHEKALEHLETAVRERVPSDAAVLGQLAANVFGDTMLETDPRYRELLSGLWDDG
jgi:TolB-like protein/Tfp pilus assembly protein PilF